MTLLTNPIPVTMIRVPVLALHRIIRLLVIVLPVSPQIPLRPLLIRLPPLTVVAVEDLINIKE